MIAKIDDFRSMKIWEGNKYHKKSFFYKDNGHKKAALQPFEKKSILRPWSELIESTSLMLFIEDMVKNKKNRAVYRKDSP